MTKLSGGDSKNTLYCSFCGKSQHEVRKLIAGPTVFICDECVELCMDIIREENKSTLVKTDDGVPTPQEICDVLDDYVIGQAHAKRVLSVAVHNHYKRLNHGAKSNDVEIAKSNILLAGPTGSGKTGLPNMPDNSHGGAWDGRIYLSSYHAGLWIVDIETLMVLGLEEGTNRSVAHMEATIGYHLPHGEDGVAQSYFEYLRIPYTHSGIISSYNAMNKIISKEIFKKNKIKSPMYFVLKKEFYNKIKINIFLKKKESIFLL